MNRSDQQKIRMREKRRGIGFETVAVMGGRYRRNTHGHTYSKSMDQPDKVANLARGQLNREMKDSPVRVSA